MRPDVRHMPEDVRRAHQAAIGLSFQTQQVTQEKSTNTMDQAQTTKSSAASRAERVLEHLSQNPSFKEVAMHELKRAAVYVPLIATTAVGVLWMNKRLFLKAATGA